MRPDAFGICLLKQTASGAQSVASPSKIEGFRELEADLSALFINTERKGRKKDEENKNVYGSRSVYESSGGIRM